MTAIDLTIDPALQGRVRLGLLALEDLTVREADAALSAEIEAEGAAVRAQYPGARSAEVPGAADARDLYKALGLDPTKTRPSSEALLRRVLRGEPLHRVNTLVDALNLCSLRSRLPFGLYDRERLQPPLVLRQGRHGEGYEGIGKGHVNVEGRPVLADALGPFGNPTSDSARAAITSGTRSALVVAFAPLRYSTARLLAVLEATEATLTRACGGRGTDRRTLP